MLLLKLIEATYCLSSPRVPMLTNTNASSAARPSLLGPSFAYPDVATAPVKTHPIAVAHAHLRIIDFLFLTTLFKGMSGSNVANQNNDLRGK